MRCLLLLLVVAACTGDAPSDTGTPDTGSELVELVDVGTACAYGDGVPTDPGVTGGQTTFTADAPFDVQVVLEDCASGCAGAVEASCEVRLVSGEIVVTASGAYTVPTGTVDCPAVCVVVAATCPGEPLAAGPWTVDYRGGHSDTVDVPGTYDVPCASPL